MKRSPIRNAILVLAAFTTACGGDGNSSSPSPITVPPVGTTPPTTNGCTLKERQDWAFTVLKEWYLFPDALPSSLDTGPYTSVNSYVDALVATARAQRKDRFFTYVTSIADENAFFSSGSSAGFGVRLSTDTANRRVFIAEAFEGAPALAAGIDRGSEILAIGTGPTDLRTVSAIIASEGAAGVSAALGPSTAGTTRLLRVADSSGTRDLTVTKADFSLTPLSSRYGAQTLADGGKQIGYINMRTFISTADQQLKNAFADFRSKGITDFIIDFRYNGGGLVSTAELMSDLLGGNRTSSEILSRTTFRAEKANNNSTRNFTARPEATAPIRIAFIATGATASASELVMNTFSPYLGTNIALVGSNTFGKPVGQIGIDRAACDDRMRVVAFSTQNANNGGFYFDGLAASMPNTCSAGDDFSKPLGDPQEASVRAALDFIAGRSCTPIKTAGISSQSQRSSRELLAPMEQTVAQREVAGLF
jgi:carboxyl-terminal processing protease